MKDYLKVFSILTLYMIVYILLSIAMGRFFNLKFPVASDISKIIAFILVVLPVVYHNRRLLKSSNLNLFRLLAYSIVLIILVFAPRIYQNGWNIEFGFLEKHSQDYFVLKLLISVLVVPISEELIYKSYALEYLEEQKKNIVWIVVSISIVFGLFHLPGIYNIVYFTIFSILLCLVYLKERNIYYPIILHALYNLLILVT